MYVEFFEAFNNIPFPPSLDLSLPLSVRDDYYSPVGQQLYAKMFEADEIIHTPIVG